MIFFGNSSEHILPDHIEQLSVLKWLEDIEPFKNIIAPYAMKKIIFPRQVHGIGGLIIKNSKNIASVGSFVHNADWMITNVPALALGILTADCIPLLLYDSVASVVGAVHAGWRGATDGIVYAAVQAMRAEFGTDSKNLRVYIGPHARTCCYSVDKQFYDTVLRKPFGASAYSTTNDVLFFDLVACCVEQLSMLGVANSQIKDTNICTVCNFLYCSYRRDREHAGRNISCIGIV